MTGFAASLAPVVDSRTRVLILGSVPGQRSLEKREYYGHARNYFWRIMAAVFLEDMDCTYEERLSKLLRHGVGLWDVIESCERRGSLDKNIKSERPNDIPALVRQYPGVRLLAFNGSKAAGVYKKHFGPENIRTRIMPSTSPVPTKRMRSMEDRLEYWMAIREELI